MKRFKVVYDAQARRDLMHMYLHIKKDSPERAASYVAGVRMAIHRYAELGLTGVTRDEVKPGLRYFPYGDYVIMFYETPTELYISRIPHGSQDLPSLSYREPVKRKAL